jgi:hypothetical protein
MSTAKYCSCLMKVRGNSFNEKDLTYTNPYGICRKSVLKNSSRASCKSYNRKYLVAKMPFKLIKAYAVEKKIKLVYQRSTRKHKKGDKIENKSYLVNLIRTKTKSRNRRRRN